MGSDSVILISIIVLGGIGLLCGILLMVASKFFSVAIDERVGELITMLPGANCGVCGFAGCAQYAKNLISGQSPANSCKVVDQEKSMAIAAFIGVKNEGIVKEVAVLRCQGGDGVVPRSADYTGLKTCRAAALFFGGDKACSYGCLGYGDCVKVCPFQAISRGENGLVVINAAKCVGCGLCVKECPKEMLLLLPSTSEVYVACLSKDRGKKVTQVCKKGCIACRKCEKACPVQAIVVEDNLAKIDFLKCTNCGLCGEACPTESIGRRY
ncbi:MAG: RnfABCDGE type electron transport complex subunit B [Proteobacteria bacterium]|nr:RnfABCDGE type electron transport complex subunit B [Pseudomonadota bacterium]